MTRVPANKELLMAGFDEEQRQPVLAIGVAVLVIAVNVVLAVWVSPPWLIIGIPIGIGHTINVYLGAAFNEPVWTLLDRLNNP